MGFSSVQIAFQAEFLFQILVLLPSFPVLWESGATGNSFQPERQPYLCLSKVLLLCSAQVLGKIHTQGSVNNSLSYVEITGLQGSMKIVKMHGSQQPDLSETHTHVHMRARACTHTRTAHAVLC